MGAEDGQLTFTLVFNSETGQLQVVQDQLQSTTAAAEEMGAATSEAMDAATASTDEAVAATEELTVAQEEAGAAAEETGNKGSDGLAKIESRLMRVGLNLAMMQLALQGIMTVVKDDEGYQQLQKTFEDTAGTVMNDLAPSIHLLTQGLSGIVGIVGTISAIVAPLLSTIVDTLKGVLDVVTGLVGAVLNTLDGNIRGAAASLKQVGADVSADFKGLGDQWSDGVQKAGDRFAAMLDTMGGTAKAFTKEMAALHATELNEEIAHNNAMAKEAEDFYAKQATLVGTSEQMKLKLSQAAEAVALKALSSEEDAKSQMLRDKLATRQIDQRTYNEEIAALDQDYEDKRTQVAQAAADQRQAITQAETAKVAAAFQTQEKAFVDSAAKQIAQGKDLADAMKAGSEALIENLANEAASWIEIKGAEAAASAFANAPNIYVGAVEAAGVLAWYSALALGVSAAGSALGSAVGGGSSSSSAPSSSSTAGATPAATPTAASGSSAATNQVAAATPASGGGGGGTPLTQQINLTVLLDSQVLLKMIQVASFNGDLQIYAKAITS